MPEPAPINAANHAIYQRAGRRRTEVIALAAVMRTLCRVLERDGGFGALVSHYRTAANQTLGFAPTYHMLIVRCGILRKLA